MSSVCKDMSAMANLLDLIRKSNDIKVLRFKDRIRNPSGGWRDAMINFCVITKDCPHPHHICEIQIQHKKMFVCRNKDGLGGHDEYAIERNAREILEHLGLRQPDSAEAANSLEQLEKGKAVAEAMLTWVRRTKLSTAFRVGKWAGRAMTSAKIRAALTAPAPVAQSRPESSASKHAVSVEYTPVEYAT